MLAATRRQMAQLQHELKIQDIGQPTSHGDPALMAVAQTLGAASDLLVGSDTVTAAVLRDRDSLTAARGLVADVASIAARAALAVMTSAGKGRRAVEQRSLAAQLESTLNVLEPVAAQRDTQGLGALGGLTTGMPAIGADTFEQIAYAAAQWQRLHEEIPVQDMLTRDLRSMTAQVRTAASHARYLIRAVGTCAPHVGLGDAAVAKLRTATTALHRSDEASMRTAAAWNRHVSDLGGITSLPGEFAFTELHSAIRRTVGLPGGALRPPAELVPDRWTAIAVLRATDELVHAAHRVAAMQKRAVFELVVARRLFVPRIQAIRVDPAYELPTAVPLGRRQRTWLVAERIAFMTRLTEPLTSVTELLAEAAQVCRSLAGTDEECRPMRSEVPMKVARPEPIRARRRVVRPRHDQPDTSPAVELP
ncbi:hypothetical protein GCM10028799_38920 [Kribbella italica]